MKFKLFQNDKICDKEEYDPEDCVGLLPDQKMLYPKEVLMASNSVYGGYATSAHGGYKAPDSGDRSAREYNNRALIVCKDSAVLMDSGVQGVLTHVRCVGENFTRDELSAPQGAFA